ncbi:MAG TPA: response regulator transcription factor [Thermoanaerobaculia bacterium]
MEPIRIYILHRYQLLIEALECSLRDHPAVTVMGAANEVQAALDCLAALAVDVVLLDGHLARCQSRPAIRQLKAVARPEVKVLPVGLESDQEILECLEAGASGYVPSDASLDDLVETLEAVHRGSAPCSAQLAASVVARIAELSHKLRQRPPRRLPSGIRFTPREREILQLLIEGRRNKEIAKKLYIALPTVKIHVHKILRKMQVRNRREAGQLALESGLLGDVN